MNSLSLKKMTGRTRNFLIVLAVVIVSGAAYGTITFHQTGTPVEIFDYLFRPQEGEALGFFANIHIFSEGLYYFVLFSFFALMAVLSLAIDSNPKAQESQESQVQFPKGIRLAIFTILLAVPIFSLEKSGYIPRNIALALVVVVLITGLVVLIVKRNDD